METSIIYELGHPIIWDWRVATDLFFGGMGVGAFLFAVMVDWRYEGKYKRICQTAAWVAPIYRSLCGRMCRASTQQPLAGRTISVPGCLRPVLARAIAVAHRLAGFTRQATARVARLRAGRLAGTDIRLAAQRSERAAPTGRPRCHG